MKELHYKWKEQEWKVLILYPVDYIEWELNKLIKLYSPEYKFKIN